MQKLNRHRKAFYEKENDLMHGNKKSNLRSSFNVKLPQEKLPGLYQSVPSLNSLTIMSSQVPSNTQLFCKNYGKCVQKSVGTRANKFLINHQIDSALRARMLDWMMEVMGSYKFAHKTYFAGAQIMDRYFMNESERLIPTKLHIIGVQSMLIASKMQEVYPLKLKTVYQKIAHRKISQEDLVSMEHKITKALGYKLNSWSMYDQVLLKLNNYLYLSSKIIRSEQIFLNMHKIQDISSYLCKYLHYNYDILTNYDQALQVDCILKMTLQIVGCYESDIINSSLVEVQMLQQEIKDVIRSFHTIYKGLGNIEKFTKSDIIKIVQNYV